jgi:hypothetical protein
MVAVQHGDGALIANGRTVGYYHTVAASYGFQAGLQKIRLRHVLPETTRRLGTKVTRQTPSA